MNELSNTVTSIGNYKNIPTLLTSNTSIVNIIGGLSLIKEANKTSWSSGNLTYTITLNNQTSSVYKNLVIADVIDTKLIEFIDGSITINGIKATNNQYLYDKDTHTLTITLEEVDVGTLNIVSFNVRKAHNDFFILKSRCELRYNDIDKLYSNYVTVVSPIRKNSKTNYSCDVPYWRY